MRAGDAGWLGKHLLPGIAGGFDLGILRLGDMGRWQHRRNDVAVGRQTPRSQADSCDPRNPPPSSRSGCCLVLALIF
jgi:hypothetical protein